MSTAPADANGPTGPATTTPSAPTSISPAFPLTIVIDEKGTAKPHFRCSICQEPITDAKEASLVWRNEDPASPLVVHKGDCDLTYCRFNGYTNWIPLPMALLFLLNNSQVDLTKASHEAKRINRIQP